MKRLRNGLEYKIELWLPDAGEDGFAEEGDEPTIHVIDGDFDEDGAISMEVNLSELAQECVDGNPNAETAEVMAGWLRRIADDLRGTK